MSSAEAALRRCWRELVGERHEAIIGDVVARHREPHRRYHTAVHVMWVLHHVDELVQAARAGDRADDAIGIDLDVVRAAALFHDVIYDPRSSTNEHDSATLAVEALGEVGWGAPRSRRVAAMIEATAGHTTDGAGGEDGPSGDDGVRRSRALEVAVLLDADLAILGASPAEYRTYVAGVREEYGHVAADAWRTGRASILRAFLDRSAIYATATMRAGRERPARTNLTAELTELEAG